MVELLTAQQSEAADLFYEVRSQFRLSKNPNINTDVLDFVVRQGYHKPTKETAILYMTHLRPIANEKLSKISNQYARIIMNLRNSGCEFKKDLNDRDYMTKDHLGRPSRMIIGYKEIERVNFPRINLSKKFEKAYLNTLDFMGRQAQEIDHRIPQRAFDNLHWEIPDCNNGLFMIGDIDIYYQPISKSVNDQKRQACIKCVDGDKKGRNEILIPPIALLTNKIYRKFFDQQPMGCLGCVWFDYTVGLDEIRMNGIEDINGFYWFKKESNPLDLRRYYTGA